MEYLLIKPASTNHTQKANLVSVNKRIDTYQLISKQHVKNVYGQDIFIQQKYQTTNYSKSYSCNIITIASILLLIIICCIVTYFFTINKVFTKNNVKFSSVLSEESYEETSYIELQENEFNNDGFIFPNSSVELLTYEQIEKLKSLDSSYSFDILLHFCINEIFARHGYQFSSDGIYITHYSQYEWYNNLSKQNIEYSDLSQIEQKNVDLLVNIRNNGL
ncbi:MAG: YARHG domain-containing protein [Lachnospiraceae bacterium]|nr:YARHG domain-containing protein [Lachnospiraceae bacterium]